MVGMTEFDVCKLRDYAADLAQQAASLISTKRSEITATGDIRAHSQTKTSAVDPVTEVDTAAEEFVVGSRSEEHTSELQSRGHLVCRLLLEKKKKYTQYL